AGAPGGDKLSGHPPAHLVRQPDAHPWVRGDGPRRGLGADRGARCARDAGTLHLLPLMAGRGSVDLGRAGDDAPRRGRLSPRGTPHHAAHDRLPELSHLAASPMTDRLTLAKAIEEGGIRRDAAEHIATDPRA